MPVDTVLGFSPSDHIIQAFTLAIAILIIAIVVIWMRLHKKDWLYGVPLIIWMLHTVLYYTDVITYPDALVTMQTHAVFTTWFAVLRLHGYLTLLSIEIERPGVIQWIKQKFSTLMGEKH